MRSRWLALLPALALMGTTGCGYNTIQTMDEQANEAKSRIEVQLQRRADLVPNLVATVKGYAQHEETIFTNVANARTALLGAIRTGDPQQMATANDQLGGALGRLLAISEAYPNLKADQQFLRLQDELAGTENRIAVARNDYNEAARQYNAYIRQFPTVVTAKVIGAKSKPYFEVTDAAKREVPQVDFGRPSTGQTPTPPAPPPAKVP
ncbi:MAG TPA: LemA family protein [Gemmatimonadaceae bacterium]|nr:LemA family protein [Gemmatimonadaceae bacterium]